MLSPVTRQFTDHSTPETFAFTFYCDRCSKPVRSETYRFDLKGFVPPVDERVQTMIWNQQHEEAYERANREAGAWFNRCPVCGCRICDDCLYTGPNEGCRCNDHGERE